MPKILKIEDDARQKFQTTLGDVTVSIRLYWNATSESWFLDLMKPSGQPICMGRRLSTNVPAFGALLLPDFPGTLVPKSTTLPATELSRNSWSTTHKLVYYGPSETID